MRTIQTPISTAFSMLSILAITALHLGPILSKVSAQEFFPAPPSYEDQNAWENISAEPAVEAEEDAVQGTGSVDTSSQERVFYKYGEVKTVTPPVEESGGDSASTDGNLDVTDPGNAEIPIADPVSDEPASEPEPLPLSDEELLVTNLPPPLKTEESSWSMPAIPTKLLLFGGAVLLGMIAYWIWRIIPRFKTTMSKEAISPPPADLKSLDAGKMARLSTALGEEGKK